MSRLIALVILTAATVLLPAVLLVPLVLIYAFNFWAWELILLAVLIDAYFGSAVVAPYYTYGAIALVLIAEYSKKNLSLFLNEMV